MKVAMPPGQQCSSIKVSQNVLCSDLCTAAVPVKVRSIKSRIRTRNQQSKLPMIPFIRHLKLSVGALCGLALCANGAQAPQHINIKQLSTTVEDVVVPLPNEIFGARNKLGAVNWKEHVRQELDRTQNSVQQAMNEVNDEKLSQLVSLGGWLRGTEVLTSVVKEHFSIDGAELLHQPDLLSYFQTRLQAMPEFNVPIIHQIQDALVEVKPLIDVGNAHIPAESVKKVNEITTKLGTGIVTRD